MVGYTHYPTDPRCRREATLAARGGWETHFYALSRDGRRRDATVEGVRLHELPLDRYRGRRTAAYLGGYARFLALAGGALLRDHLRRRFDVVHVNTMPDFMAFAALGPRLLGARVILDVHDVMPELYMEKFGLAAGHWKIRLIRAVEVLSARLAHAVLTAEHPKGELLVRHGVPRGKISVLLNLPDGAIFPGAPEAPPADRAAGLDDPAAEFRLVYHGTLARRHGLDQAIEALGGLRKRWPGLRLDILGEGDELERLHAQAERLGLGDRVRFSDGLRPIEDLLPALRAAHLAVIPTRHAPSTDFMLPTKLLEYLILGVPVLVTPTRTVRHYFGEAHPLFTEDPAPGPLAEKIDWARREYGEVQRLTIGLQRAFFASYDWNRHGRAYLDLLDRLAPGARLTPGLGGP
jgi:glycosyltransferase involved in cell wall biosynthesis